MKKAILLIATFFFLYTTSHCSEEVDTIKKSLQSASNEELLVVYNRGKEALERNPSLATKVINKETISNLTAQELEDLADIKKAKLAQDIYNKRISTQRTNNMIQGALLGGLTTIGDIPASSQPKKTYIYRQGDTAGRLSPNALVVEEDQ